MSIIGAEDEDFENDLDPTVDDHCSHFNSIDLLKDRPTHLLVFLQHVMLQFDCAPLLCYLHADLFRTYSAKETKKQFVDFYNIFLDKGAILRVQVPSHLSFELDRTRPDVFTEEQQRRFVSEMQITAKPEVTRQLEDFRTKRMMGMTPNEHELQEVENHRGNERVPKTMKEKAVAENLLDKMSDNLPNISTDEEKFSVIFGAVASYMKHLGVKTKVTENKKSKGFFRKIPGMRKGADDSTRSKPRGVLPGLLSDTARRRGANYENKTTKVETEGEKDKAAPERKGSTGPHLRPAADPNAGMVSRTPAPGPPVVLQESEGSEIVETISVDSGQSDTAPIKSRTDTISVSEPGEASPTGTVGSMSTSDPLPVISLEDLQDKDRKGSSLARSESLCVDRRRSQRGSARTKQSRSRSDVDLQAATTAAQPPSPSHPQPSLSDSGLALPVEGSLTVPVPLPAPAQEEMDPRLLALEQDPPNWREQTPAELLSSLSKKEMKRQEVINELFVTEHAHVRMLGVLQNVFFRPLERKEIMTQTELNAIFPNLDEIFEMHYAFYEHLKKLRQDNYIVKAIGPTLLSRFQFKGSDGEWFQKLTARFCSHQSYALDQIKSRQRRDPRFSAFILEAESKPQCRRLQLKDIIPTEMQRLTKYPLLLENIAKSTEELSEKDSIQQAAECCRKILNHVNEEVKNMENFLTLKDYQRRLDVSGLKPCNELHLEYKNLDLTQKKMIYEGAVTWKVAKEKSVDVHCLLLADMLVLLQRQDDKMLLKCQSKSMSGVPDSKQMLSPIIKLSSAYVREVATDPKAFYVIFTWESGAQIYELVANAIVERRNWTEHIKSVMEELKQFGVSKLERMRAGSIVPMVPFSPTALHSLPPSLSLSENGSVSQSSTSEQDKFSLAEEKSDGPQHSLSNVLLAHRIDLSGHSRTHKVGREALEQVDTLKRLLVGSISIMEVPVTERESFGDKQDLETESAKVNTAGVQLEGHHQENMEESPKAPSEDGISAPVVLSQARMSEVLRQLSTLEQQVKQLQNVEEEYHRLQEIVSKLHMAESSSQ